MEVGRVLIVDDDEDLLAAIGSLIEAEGYQVLTLLDGKVLKKKVDTFKPDCVLLDVMLPGDPGPMLSKKLKGHPDYEDLPIILMSANEQTQNELEDSLADSFVSKPFDYYNLLDLIAQYVNKHKKLAN